MQVQFSAEIAPPKKREQSHRLTPELKAIQPGFSVLLDKATADCLVSYLRYHKLGVTRQQEGDKVRVWRLT